ncbi:DUF2326 domain-containing protein [Aeromicrobium sp. CTD01-1L150]|uniref:DUF2326 domain-containing protein n=1 Tax=Aeromicrobium sp. CTD01-1L150 TaxID=3341830 RepID=UPI0035C1A299
MLRRISSNKSTFTPIDFKSGLNVVLAERSEAAGTTDSRNARGKSTLLHILHFMLGGDAARQLNGLRNEGWRFQLDLDLLGAQVSVTRGLDDPGTLDIEYPAAMTESVSLFLTEGRLKASDWKDLLGLALFGLEPEVSARSYGISVRTLFNYVIRMDPGKDPLKVIPVQPAWSSRQHVAFMLGLDWEDVYGLREVNRDIDSLKAVDEALARGLIGVGDSEATLLMEKSSISSELSTLTGRVDGFEILEDPDGLVDRANALTARLATLRDEQLVDQRMADLYRSSLRDALERGPELVWSDVADVYEQVGIQLDPVIRRRIEDVREFHDVLARNRGQYLETAISETTARLETRSTEMTALASQRDDVMRAVNAGGALEELIALRDEVSGLERRLHEIDVSLDQARNVTIESERLKVERAQLRQVTQSKLEATRDELDRISVRFDQRMRALYGFGGVLQAAVDDSGYVFKIEVPGQNSTGVSKMKTFCFDLALLEEGMVTGHHPDFLAHDSSLFDGVDPRQVASALTMAQELTTASGLQYVCTLNSNDVDGSVLKSDWFRSCVVREVMDTEEGGILGVRF